MVLKNGIIQVGGYNVARIVDDYPQIEHLAQSVGASKLLGTRFKENHHDFHDFFSH